MATATHNVVVGTSGHIDHGKTSLVKALTGIDADRWAEEKRRGITIDIGFASLDLEPGLTLGFVDVPGHERFIKNMLAGVAGIDLVLLVVAADESVMPQTREHFEICRLLGIRRGVIALTKSDLVDEEILELVTLEVEEFVAGSFLESSPVVPVSSTTGEGLGELRQALASVAKLSPGRSSEGLLRLPIDRVFTMKGFGTVVTGTLAAGKVRTDDTVEILPGSHLARVRNVEVHGSSVNAAIAGQRTALNLGGTSRSALSRGQCVLAPRRFTPTVQFDARVELLASAKPLKHGAPVHVHLGTAETVGRAYLLDAPYRRSGLPPGSRAFVQMRLTNPLVAVSGDPFILRQFSPLTTIAGGSVLHPQAPRHRGSDPWRPLLEAFSKGDAQPILELLCDGRPYGLDSAELTSLTGRPTRVWREAANASPRLRVLREDPLWVCSREAVSVAGQRLLQALERFHSNNPLVAGASVQSLRSSEFGDAPGLFAETVLQDLVQSGHLVLDAELVRKSDHAIRFQEDERRARDQLVEAFKAAGLRVPMLKEFLPTLEIDGMRAQRILAALLRDGVLVKVTHELVFHGDAVRALTDSLADRRGQRINVGEFKALADVSRKYAIPLLEHLDRNKVTLRDGDSRWIL